MLPDELVDIQRLPVVDFTDAPVIEETGIVDSGGDQPGLPILGTAVCDAGNAFLYGLQAALRPVRALGKHAEGNRVRQHIVYLVEALVILADMFQPVPFPDHGKDAEKVEDAGDGGLPEDIGPGAECGRALPRGQDHQRVHERIGMVGGEDDGSVLGEFRAPVQDAVVTLPGAPVYIRPEKGIQAVLFPNLSHCACCG